MKTYRDLQEKVDAKAIRNASKKIREIIDILQDLQDDGDFMAPQAAMKDISKIIPALLDADDMIKRIK